MTAFLERLGSLQFARPWAFIVAAYVAAALAAPGAFQLRLNGDFTALLPDHKPAVQDLDIIEKRYGGKATLTLMLSGPDIEDLRRVTDAIAPEIAQLEKLGVAHVDWNVRDFIEFAEDNRFLYAGLEDLEEINDSLYARLRHEMEAANPLVVSLDDSPPPDPEEVAERLAEKTKEAQQERTKYPDGYFQHPEQNLIAIFIRSSIRGGETASVNRLLSALDRLIAEKTEALGATEVEHFYGGDMMDVKEEGDALTRAVISATIITLVLVYLSIFIFFRSFRSVPLLGLALLAPVIVTFAIAYAVVEYLNASTAFLSSIVVGNGINPNIIWLARYYELRRAGIDARTSVMRTHAQTWAATLTASLAAGLAYASLMFTDFRGFRDFGIIGGTGMVLCWLGAYLLLPALTAASERASPMRVRSKVRRAQYGAVFARLASSQPRLIIATSLVFTAASIVLVVQAIRANPLEYDFRNLQSKRDPDSRVQWVNDRQGEIVDETTTGSSIAILLDDRAETSTVVAQLNAYREEFPTAFGAIRTLDDLVPQDQEDKLEILEEIRDVIPKLKEYADPEQLELLEENQPPEDLAKIEVEDLPDSVLRFFRDQQGHLGRIIYLEHNEERNGWDGKYMVEWAGAARSVRLASGGRPPVVGQPPIFVDLLDAIFQDGPKAVLIALAATMALLLLTFRYWSERLLTLASLLVGILWMAALMALGGIKLNFLNFVAFPITFGNGVDYGVNVMRRFVQELDVTSDGVAAVKSAVKGTGGAVILCSLTTIIGYISLYTSSNKALNSFGAAMAISEVTCVASGVLALPAALILLYRRTPSKK